MNHRVRHHFGMGASCPIPRVGMSVYDRPGAPMSSVYRPMVCMVLQGAKEVAIGDRVLRYGAASCFIASVDVPVTGRVTEASPDRPYVVTSLALDRAVLTGLLADAPAAGPSCAEEPVMAGFGVAPVTPDLCEAWDQLLALLDAPDDIAVLGPAREREVLYRLLQSRHGPMLRQIGREDSRLSRVRRAIDWIREHFDRPLRIEALAGLAGMSQASFHRHFKGATGMSPLQYQKSLRLQAARRLLAISPDAARAAFAVGYESASQFSREYARQFGAPPSRDAARLAGLVLDSPGAL